VVSSKTLVSIKKGYVVSENIFDKIDAIFEEGTQDLQSPRRPSAVRDNVALNQLCLVLGKVIPVLEESDNSEILELVDNLRWIYEPMLDKGYGVDDGF